MRHILVLLTCLCCILKTQTSAQSVFKWEKIVPLPGGFGNGLFINSIESVSAVNDSVIFICPTVGTRPPTNGQPFLLMKSTNGGRTWDSVPFPNKTKPSRIHFVNKDTGFASVTFDGRIWKTINGGESWSEVIIKPGFANIQNWFFLDDKTIFLTGNDDGENGYYSGNSLFAKSTDGGNSWKLTQLKGIVVISLSFLTDNIGVLAGASGSFACTTDGGYTFDIKQKFSGEFMYGVQVIDSSKVIIGGERGGLFISDDFCKNWKQLTTPGNIYHLKKLLSNTLFMGSWGKLLFSYDFGNSWQIDTDGSGLFSGSRSLVRSSSFVTNGTGWVAGWDTVILKGVPGIKTTLSKTNLCINDTFSVSITIDESIKVNDNNPIWVELSDYLGNFSSPTILATYTSKPFKGNIICQLLESSKNLPGKTYKIRIRLGKTDVQTIDNVAIFRKSESIIIGPTYANREVEQIYSVENVKDEFYKWSCKGVAKIIGRDDSSSVRVISEIDGQADLNLTTINIGNCFISQSKTIFFKGIVDVNERSNNLFDIDIDFDISTPISSGDLFRMKNPKNSSIQTISIINILGNKEYEFGEFTNGYEESTFRVPSLHSGIYFIVLKSKNDYVCKRIIVSN